MILAGLTGAYGGWELVRITPAPQLRVIFAIFLAFVGVFILVRSRRKGEPERSSAWMV